jgi:hypothetical protein
MAYPISSDGVASPDCRWAMPSRRLSCDVSLRRWPICYINSKAYQWSPTSTRTFAEDIPTQAILQALTDLGITINYRESVLQPTTQLTHLELGIDGTSQTLRQTPQHLWELLTLVFLASAQDLDPYRGYVTWLCCAMSWPIFLSTQVRDRATFFIRQLH